MKPARERVDDFEIVSRSAALIPAVPLDRLMLADAEREVPERLPVFPAPLVAEIFFGHRGRFGGQWLYRLMGRYPIDAAGNVWQRPGRRLAPSVQFTLAEVERLVHHLYAVDAINFRQFVSALQVVMWIAKVNEVYA